MLRDGGDDRFRVNLGLFRDGRDERDEQGEDEFEVENEPVNYIEEADDGDEFEVGGAAAAEEEEFEVKEKKTYPLYPDIKQYNEWCYTRYGGRFELPNVEYKYFLTGGAIFGLIVGGALGFAFESKNLFAVGVFIGLTAGIVLWKVFDGPPRDDFDDEEEDDVL